jgi:hypothetical protein
MVGACRSRCDPLCQADWCFALPWASSRIGPGMAKLAFGRLGWLRCSLQSSPPGCNGTGMFAVHTRASCTNPSPSPPMRWQPSWTHLCCCCSPMKLTRPHCKADFRHRLVFPLQRFSIRWWAHLQPHWLNIASIAGNSSHRSADAIRPPEPAFGYDPFPIIVFLAAGWRGAALISTWVDIN